MMPCVVSFFTAAEIFTTSAANGTKHPSFKSDNGRVVISEILALKHLVVQLSVKQDTSGIGRIIDHRTTVMSVGGNQSSSSSFSALLSWAEKQPGNTEFCGSLSAAAEGDSILLSRSPLLGSTFCRHHLRPTGRRLVKSHRRLPALFTFYVGKCLNRRQFRCNVTFCLCPPYFKYTTIRPGGMLASSF